MVGTLLAEQEGWKAGDQVTLNIGGKETNFTVSGIFDAGGEEDQQIYAPLSLVQEMTDRKGKVSTVEVSALTTPDNELAKRAARNPSALSSRDYETWYCTAYVSAICYQIQEAIPGSSAAAVRQVAESEGTILDKTKLLMILITILSLIGAALGISNLVTASVMERAKDAQLIGRSVFGSAIEMKARVIPIVAALILLVTLAGSLPAIRMVLRLRPAEVLHGGQ